MCSAFPVCTALMAERRANVFPTRSMKILEESGFELLHQGSHPAEGVGGSVAGFGGGREGAPKVSLATAFAWGQPGQWGWALQQVS